MTDRQLERSIEWEAASEPIVLEHLTFPTPLLMPGTSKVTIARDDNLQLQLVGEGVLTEGGAYKRRRDEEGAIEAGAFYPTSEVSIDTPGGKLALRMHVEHVPFWLQLSGRERRFRQRGLVQKLLWTFSQRFVFDETTDTPRVETISEPAWRSDWYVNGVTGLHFARR